MDSKSKSPIKRIEQPQRGCGRLCASGNRHNRVAVGNVCWTMTQGSAFRATLIGFETESSWDSRRVEFESPHLSSNGAKSISTFVFPGGADLLLQRLIHKLKQRLRRRIVRQAEILVKFAVVGFLGREARARSWILISGSAVNSPIASEAWRISADLASGKAAPTTPSKHHPTPYGKWAV